MAIAFWQGPSLLDGQPIVALATYKSENGKTGDMVQTWILRDDVDPWLAVTTDQDRSVCGDCALRRAGCYVQVPQAPLSAWKHWRKHGRVAHPENVGRGSSVRIGSYGDPAAVPLDVWHQVTSHATGWTGYTHQWRHAPLGLSRYCMASVESLADAAVAQAMGWRTYRAGHVDSGRAPGEALCPASDMAGHKLTCADCLYCAYRGTGNVFIPFHGPLARRQPH